MDSIIELFGNNLKTLRKQYNETQEELAERIGSTRQTISYYESGNCKEGPTLNFINDIAIHYNVSPGSLIQNIIEDNDIIWTKNFELGDLNKKKIIEGRTYNTNTAYEIEHHWNNYSPGDFNWQEDYLFRKKNGEFFLYGKGGARSSYAVPYGNNCWQGGEGFTPLTEKDAKKWLEENGYTDKYILLFGEPNE